ncbi:MAG: sigma-54-dependent Fis family transcriptional regulator [Candidatus Hydrogenedentes bacterium]|nr:sigma-54-dependent Fis family transcriptional regulator [Candidatus Hydrogenedentota bacterium]
MTLGFLEMGRPPAPPQIGARLLVVDTDAGVRWSLEKGLSLSGHTVFTAATVEQALQITRDENIQAVLMEFMPEAGLNLDVLSALLQMKNAPSVICASIDSMPQLVIECMRRGAADFLIKPFSLAEVRSAIAKTLSHKLRQQNYDDYEEDPEHASSLLIGVSPPMLELRSIVKQVAQTDLNCLIRGESGAGKDVVAREIHRLSKRCEKPIIKVNCSALPEHLLESELFGYERGAFTGATSSKPGRFSLADKGIIFLDEIGEMHINLQAKLLQVIEHKEFTKLGGRTSLRVDVQIVAATNADLETMVQEGAFRQDLFFRLNEVCIWVPPLSIRKEDIPLLVRHFVKKYGNFVASGSPAPIGGEELEQLCRMPWPGNVRELESTIKRWMVLGRQGGGGAMPAAHHVSLPPVMPAPAVEEKPEPTPEEMRQILEDHHWNRRKAADAMGISYQVLRRRIEKFKLDQR